MTDEEIYEKLNQIDDLKDRVLLKSILNGVFVNLKEESEKKFSLLEKKVFDEVQYENEKYKVFATVMKRNKIDLTDEFLFTMIPQDLKEPVYEIKDILNSLEEKRSFSLFNVFMECDYLTFKKFLESDLSINGVIITNKKKYEARFIIKKNLDYINKIKRLYRIFINNNIPWSTINNPYIHKFANVILVGTKEELNSEEKIEKIDIDFGEYSKYIRYDMVPMWNVKEEAMKSTSFPVPCVDKINFEHNIQVAKGNGYLVEVDEESINYVMFKEGTIIVSSDTEKSDMWNVLEIISSQKMQKKQYDYEIMSNKVKISFSNRMFQGISQKIKTKTDLARVVDSYEVSRFLKFKDTKLINIMDRTLKETYEVNDFIVDEIRDSNVKKVLILSFEAQEKNNYLNYDILSFIISEVQFIYPEYECEGRLI
ncbi:normocyte-binding protein [Clostridium butyricum]|uniref:normocyte-binding protein n=2 Tax=Clostridium butyricum TaxID=1492 RepID=UPI0018AB0F6F|nr:normocyte-binding protein [Clostridium butyricum]